LRVHSRREPQETDLMINGWARRGASIKWLAVAGLLLLPRLAFAQLNGFNIKGDQGLKAGSQAPQGIYAGAPLVWYNTKTVKNKDGKAITANGDLTLFLGGPLINVVTPRKLFGANYGFMVVFLFANARLELPRLDQNPSAGISDLYVQPFNLGWHTRRADVLTGYGLFMPTGRYTAGADNNTGLGMWGHEAFLASTLFLDEKKSWHATTTAALEFHSKKKDSDAQVGTLLTSEGGVGRDFVKGAISTGLAYYAQWKLTDDTLTGAPALLVRGKNRVAGLGPELTLPIATKTTVYGFLTLRYQWEFGARTTTEGDALNILVVLPLKPIKIAP
jgi:hypothetical protein